MDTELIKRVIGDQRKEIEGKLSKEHIVKRAFIKEIESAFKGSGLLVLTGARRGGKSITAALLGKNNFSYVNFDDPSLEGIKGGDLINVREAIAEMYGEPHTMIFDEVQNAAGWELLATRLRENHRVIVTGSNAQIFSEELASRLTGRYIKFTVMPFSFAEYCSYIGSNPDINTTEGTVLAKRRLNEYIKIGGFPEAYRQGYRIISQIYEDIITKDIEKRYNIKYKATFREIARYIISNSSSRISLNALKGAFSIKSVHTVKNYLAFLENAHLVFIVNRFSGKLKQHAVLSKKVYCIDNGIFYALGFRIIDNKAKLMENLVAIELFRRKFYMQPNSEVYYWQDTSQREVDFVLKNGDQIKQLLQVSYDLSAQETRRRETTALLRASKSLRCNNLVIITWDYEGEIKESGKSIKCIPLWKWLLK